MVLQAIDKALVLMKFVSRIKDILNKNPTFIQSTQGLDYSYFIKVVDNNNQEVSKFTIGLKDGKMELKPSYKPDVILTLTENAFFSIIRGKMTLEESYFSGEADIFTSDGAWSTHLPNIKIVFDSIQKEVLKELGEI